MNFQMKFVRRTIYERSKIRFVHIIILFYLRQYNVIFVQRRTVQKRKNLKERKLRSDLLLDMCRIKKKKKF